MSRLLNRDSYDWLYKLIGEASIPVLKEACANFNLAHENITRMRMATSLQEMVSERILTSDVREILRVFKVTAPQGELFEDDPDPFNANTQIEDIPTSRKQCNEEPAVIQSGL